MEQLERKKSLTKEDMKLVGECLSGNRDAQRALFNRYKEKVYSLVVHNLGPNYELDDIVQTVFVKLFRSLAGFKGLSSLDTWVYRITAKSCTDVLRKKYRKRQLSLVQGGDNIENLSASERDKNPLEQKEHEELKDALYNALNNISSDKRLVVTLFELEGMSLNEIAEIVKKPVGTVKSRLFHGRKELSVLMKDYLDK